MQSGSSIGPYKVMQPLGEGGMGQVWRARDTRLDRDVALKVLPDGFADDPERLARFDREAKTLAALNHAGIAQVYGLEHGVSPVIVMELVEGEDLAQRLQRGPLPLEEALPVARQIAEALEAAHEAGIVHRDLKPANVKVRPDGTVKVLDFGLAKTTASAAGSGTLLANSPTLMSPAATAAGVILGTAAYMAPEQAKGQPLGPRADVWAFGVMLHEMLTGRRLFEGETVAETLAAVLRAEISLDDLPADTPASVRWLLGRCLQRDLRKRLAAIGEAARVLADPQEALGVVAAGARGSARGPMSRLPWVALGLAAGAALGALAINALRPAALPQTVGVHRFAIPVGDGAPEVSGLAGRMVSLSDDGTLLSYTDLTVTPSRQWLRPLADATAVPTELRNAVQLRFAPDRRSFAAILTAGGAAFLARGALPVDTYSGVGRGALAFDWMADGSLLYADGGALWRSPAPDAQPVKLVALGEPDAYALSDIDLLPGDEVMVATRAPVDATGSTTGSHEVVAISLRTGETLAHLASNAISGRYTASGHLLFARGWAGGGEPEQPAALMAVPFDAGTLQVHGEAVPVVQGVGNDMSFAMAQYDLSSTGTLAYVPFRARRTLRHTLVRVRPDGSTEDIVSEEAVSMDRPRLSPDGRRVAVQVVTPQHGLDVWVYEVDRAGARLRLTDEGDDYDPVWSHDGRMIYYSSNRSDREQLFVKRADGGGTESLVLEENLNVNAHSWHPDGVTLAYYARGLSGDAFFNRDIGILHLGESPPRAEAFLATAANERGPVFSPDGQWIAYASDQSGRDEIYITDYPERGSILTVSTGGGREPVWGRDGRKLFYRNEDDFFRVDVQLGDEPRLGTPALHVSGPYARESIAPSGSLSYDVAADGSLLVVRREGRVGDPTQVMVVLNFLEELARLAPPGR